MLLLLNKNHTIQSCGSGVYSQGKANKGWYYQIDEVYFGTNKVKTMNGFWIYNSEGMLLLGIKTNIDGLILMQDIYLNNK